MALTTYIGCFYLTLSMISVASLSMNFDKFSIARGQMEMPLPLPSLSSNTSQAPQFPPQLPSPQITHPQVPSSDQDHFPQVQPPLINSTTLANNKIDLSNFLRDYSANFSSCNQLAVSNIIASGSQSSSPARNAIDNNINTRWSNLGLGSLITFDFGAERFLCNIDIAWYRGNERVINFTISASNDSQSWKPLVMNSSSGTSSESESYDLPDIAARYLQITVTGSSLSDWVSISEAKVFGSLLRNSSANIPQSGPASPIQTLSCTPLGITTVNASGNQADFPPQNVIDNNIKTRWANHDLKSSITLDLGKEAELCSINISWFKGNERTTDFSISVSNDSNSFIDVLTHTSTGSTPDFEGYNLPDIVSRYVRITVTGSTESGWASISEIKIFGT
jgi:F5/8 type C domain-containing protein